MSGIVAVIGLAALAWLGLNAGLAALTAYAARQREKRGIRGPWWYE